MRKSLGFCQQSQISLRILMRSSLTWRLLLINSVSLIKRGNLKWLQIKIPNKVKEAGTSFYFYGRTKKIKLWLLQTFSHHIYHKEKILTFKGLFGHWYKYRLTSSYPNWGSRQFSDSQVPEDEPKSMPQCWWGETRGPLENSGECSRITSWTTCCRNHSSSGHEPMLPVLFDG